MQDGQGSVDHVLEQANQFDSISRQMVENDLTNEVSNDGSLL